MTLRICKTCDIKSDDGHKNGASKASKTGTVTRMVSLTSTSPVTGDIFEVFHIKNDDSSEDGELDTHHVRGGEGREGGEG